VYSTTNLVVEWSEATETVSGDPVTITRHEVIITKVVLVLASLLAVARAPARGRPVRVRQGVVRPPLDLLGRGARGSGRGNGSSRHQAPAANATAVPGPGVMTGALGR